jgi:hypothetical protein
MTHAGRTPDIEATDTTFRVYDRDELLAEVPRHHQTDRPVQGPQSRTAAIVNPVVPVLNA